MGNRTLTSRYLGKHHTTRLLRHSLSHQYNTLLILSFSKILSSLPTKIEFFLMK